MACIITRKLASASSSLMLAAMAKPSHQTVVAGCVPPAIAGEAESRMCSATVGATSVPGRTWLASEPQKLVMATSLASRSGTRLLDEKVR